MLNATKASGKMMRKAESIEAIRSLSGAKGKEIERMTEKKWVLG